MKYLTIMTLALVLGIGTSCFETNVDLDGNNGGGSSPPPPPDNGGTTTGEASDDAQPSQLPAAGGDDWKRDLAGIAGQIFLGSEKGVVFYAFDTLAYPDEPTNLVARVQSTWKLESLRGVTVEFTRDGQLVGTATTGNDGYASMTWTPPREGYYRFDVSITDVPEGMPQQLLELSTQPLIVAVHDKDTPLVIVDLDHTLVGSSFFRVLLGQADPMPGSRTVMERIAAEYAVVYLTHRPDLLTRRSKSWLDEYGYPQGPLLVAGLAQLADSGEFKSAKLSALQKAYPNVKIGIGDKISDALAYVDNGLAAYLIPDYDRNDADSIRDKLQEMQPLKGREKVQVVDSWQQIEQGIFQGREFPVDPYFERMKRRAESLDDDEEEDDD